MLIRILFRSFERRKGRIALAVLAVAFGAALATALLAISLDITDKMGKELRAFGANIVAAPSQRAVAVEIAGMRYSAGDAVYLDENDLPKLKTIFWRNNIVGFAPFLSGVVDAAPPQAAQQKALLVGTWFEKEIAIPTTKRTIALPGGAVREVTPENKTFATGIKSIAPWWKIEGAWIGAANAVAVAGTSDGGTSDGGTSDGGIIVGSALAKQWQARVGDPVRVAFQNRPYEFTIVGIASTGGFEENQMFVDLATAQQIFDLPNKIERVQISALVKPDDALALRAKRDPKSLPPEDFVTWYCSPYIDAITFQVEEVLLGSQAKPIRQVAEAEGAFLSKIGLTLALVTVVALAVSALGVMATMTATVMERRVEVGLMKALGGQDLQIALQFLLEATACGILGGMLGYGAGLALATVVGQAVFADAIAFNPMVLAITLALGVLVAVLGSLMPVRQAMRVNPVVTLRGE
ncbi:MAG: ABC transporter permease [Chloroflexi bacterium]|nr:ABC transporter permease [Chloroflexota bacterium]